MEIRPRFSEEISWEKEQAIEAFKTQLDDSETVVASIWEHHIVLKIPAKEQHFWSPQLTISFETVDSGTLVRGLCGPKPTVWMMFVFFYFILGFIGTMVMIMGFAQMNLGLSAGILWLLPAIGFLLLLVFLSARMGQRLGKEEMQRLFDFYRNTLHT
jgi:hypothetical protein